MRGISLLLLGATFASCTYGPPPPGSAPYAEARTPSGERAYQNLIAGRVAGQPLSCLPQYNQNDMSIIDGRNVVFRVGTRTSYLVTLSEGCQLLGSGNYALLSRQLGSPGLCRGDIQQVVDTMNRITVGSCTVQNIVPYTRP